eukprot:3779707-Alexandrium_andersonii.AAC.1
METAPPAPKGPGGPGKPLAKVSHDFFVVVMRHRTGGWHPSPPRAPALAALLARPGAVRVGAG